MKRNRSLLEFFSPHREERRLRLDSSQVDDEIDDQPSSSGKDEDASSETNLVWTDVGNYIDRKMQLSDVDKLNLLENAFVPDSDFKFPYSTRLSKGVEEKRYLKEDHFKRCPYLTYSVKKEGLFCRYCVIFGPDTVGHNKGQNLGKLTIEPLTNYSRLFGRDGYLDTHTKNVYHQNSVLKAEDFTKRVKNPSLKIDNILDSNKSQQISENRARLIPIVKTIIECGRNGLALRGHRDHGQLVLTEPVERDGNFRSLLRFRHDSGDTAVAMIANAPKNSLYTSPEIQNELITIIGEEMSDQILARIKSGKFFSVIADETTDASRIEQLNVCLRYMHESNIHEDFIKFVSVSDLTGKGLAKTILQELESFGLDTKYLVGQGYDGASAMSGQFNGVQAEIKRNCPNATYVHCSSHCLNLSLSKASNVQKIRNCVGTVSETVTFVNSSAKRLQSFISEVEETSPNSRKKRLVRLCETRWTERHESILRFRELFDEVIHVSFHVN